MKISTLLSGCLLAGVLWAPARTWTSADGNKSFEGELQSYDKAAGKLTVLVDGHQIVFSKDKLSEEDQSFLADWKPMADKKAEMASEETEGKEMMDKTVGSKLTKEVLSKLDGGKLKEAELGKDPEYYLLYVSASW